LVEGDSESTSVAVDFLEAINESWVEGFAGLRVRDDDFVKRMVRYMKGYVMEGEDDLIEQPFLFEDQVGEAHCSSGWEAKVGS